jgi:nucleoside-diphosphate-sugar epimerase
MNWSDRRVLVTGGASFVGSALVDALVHLDARVRVVDNLTSGRLDNLRHHLAAAAIEYVQGDLLDAFTLQRALDDVEVVFHLASTHEGCARPRPDMRACDASVTLDRRLIEACASARVDTLALVSCASAAGNDDVLDAVAPPAGGEPAAGRPGAQCARARAAAERTLRMLARQRRLKTVSCRYFSVYGERDAGQHPVSRLVANAFAGERPFMVPANQLCRWTYVRDVAHGILLAATRIDDGTAVDLETIERVYLHDAARALLEYAGHQADIEVYPDVAPQPIFRQGDPSIARTRLGWTPAVTVAEGLHRTIDWYFSANGRARPSAGRWFPLAPPSAMRVAAALPGIRVQ